MFYKITFTVLLLVVANTFATDWPHWRGPFYDGSTDEVNLPSVWSKTENTAWAAPLPGPSSATPIISRKKVFVSSADKDSNNLYALCFDSESGKQLWKKQLGSHSQRIPYDNFAAPSPVSDGNYVYFLFGSGNLAGLDYDGNIVWSRNLISEYGNIAIKFGYSSSPLVYEGKLYVLVLRRPEAYREPRTHEPLDSFLLAIDTKTGKDIYKHVRPTDAIAESFDSYASPIPFKNGNRIDILIGGADYFTGHDPETGRELWRYNYSPARKDDMWRLVPSPVVGGGLIFGVQPRGNKLFAIKTGIDGAVGQENVAWSFEGPTPDVSTPLYYKGLLYVLDGMRYGKVITCFDAKTGEQKWQGKIGGRGPWRSSLTAGDKKLYCINESGQCLVLQAGEKEFKILSSIELGEKPSHSSIAICDSKLFIRTGENLYCIGSQGGENKGLLSK